MCIILKGEQENKSDVYVKNKKAALPQEVRPLDIYPY